MKSSTTYVLIGLFVVVVVAMFGFAAYQKQQLANTESTVPESTPDTYAGITKVDVKHFYINGQHTLVGEIPLPTPCDVLGASAAATVENNNPVINLDLTVTNNAEMCAQVMTPQKFMVTVEAGANPIFDARLNGRAIELNIIPAAPGETPEAFELFLKG